MGSSHRGVNDFISEALECPVCTQIFDQPRQLQCGHSLCTHCIDRMVELKRQSSHGLGGHTRETLPISISCPVCRDHTTIPATGLSINYALGELVARFHTTQELRRNCGDCQQSVNYEAQMLCATCSEQAPISSHILCIKCALNEHSKRGHQIQQMEPSLEVARREAIQQIADLKASATICILECETACSDVASLLLHLPDSLKSELQHFDTLQSDLELMDICLPNVSKEKVNEAGRFVNEFREACNACVVWLQNLAKEATDLKGVLANAIATNHISSANVSDCASIQDLTISEDRQEGRSNGTTNCLQFIRSTPPQRTIEIIRQRRQAAIARRRSGTRHATAEHQLRSNNALAQLGLSSPSSPIIIHNSNLSTENDLLNSSTNSGQTNETRQQQQQEQQRDVVQSEEAYIRSNMN